MSARRTALVAIAMAASVWSVGRPCLAAPEPMTRTQIIDLAKTGVGYSYWWGHGGWRADGADPGSCSGSCPSCTHTGSYGADCSGFAGKVWQLPSPSPIENDQHPYSTLSFRNDFTYWSQIDWSEVQMADAFVRNDGSAGHIFIYESGDAWGSVWAYECKSCALGCVHDLRTITTDYIAIRRDLVQDDPVTPPDAGPEAEPAQDAGPDVADEPPGSEDAGGADQLSPDTWEPEPFPEAEAPGADAAGSAPMGAISGVEENANCACRAAGAGQPDGRERSAWLAVCCMFAARTVFRNRPRRRV